MREKNLSLSLSVPLTQLDLAFSAAFLVVLGLLHIQHSGFDADAGVSPPPPAFLHRTRQTLSA